MGDFVYFIVVISSLLPTRAYTNDTYIYGGKDNFSAAQQTCVHYNATLVSPNSANDNQALLDFLLEAEQKATWLNVEFELTPWHWAQDSGLLYNQGCFKDEDVWGLLIPGFVQIISLDDCVESCKKSTLAFKFAGIKQFLSDTPHWQCYCSHTLPSPDLAVQESNCGARCPGDTPNICGTGTFTRMVATKAQNDIERWSNVPIDTGQLCGAVTITNNWGKSIRSMYTAKVNCAHNLRPLCLVSHGPQEDSPSHLTTVFAYTSKQELSWFGISSFCSDILRAKGGHLLSMTYSLGKRLENILEPGVKYWIPLKAWKWKDSPYMSDGTAAITNWSDGHPQIQNGTCAYLLRSGEWKTEKCQEEYPFICLQDARTYTDIPSSQASVTMPTDVTVVMEEQFVMTAKKNPHLITKDDLNFKSVTTAGNIPDTTAFFTKDSTLDIQVLLSQDRETNSLTAMAAGVIAGVAIVVILVVTLTIIGLRIYRARKLHPKAVHNPIYRIDSDMMIHGTSDTINSEPSIKGLDNNALTYETIQDVAPWVNDMPVSLSHYDVPHVNPYSVPENVMIGERQVGNGPLSQKVTSESGDFYSVPKPTKQGDTLEDSRAQFKQDHNGYLDMSSSSRNVNYGDHTKLNDTYESIEDRAMDSQNTFVDKNSFDTKHYENIQSTSV